MPVQPPLDIDLDGIGVDGVDAQETRPADGTAEEGESLLPPAPKSPVYTKYRKSAYSAIKTRLTRRTTKWKLERAGFDEYTADLIGSLKHHMRGKSPSMDIVNVRRRRERARARGAGRTPPP